MSQTADWTNRRGFSSTHMLPWGQSKSSLKPNSVELADLGRSSSVFKNSSCHCVLPANPLVSTLPLIVPFLCFRTCKLFQAWKKSIDMTPFYRPDQFAASHLDVIWRLFTLRCDFHWHVGVIGNIRFMILATTVFASDRWADRWRRRLVQPFQNQSLPGTQRIFAHPVGRFRSATIHQRKSKFQESLL